jgi:hypothetical protein
MVIHHFTSIRLTFGRVRVSENLPMLSDLHVFALLALVVISTFGTDGIRYCILASFPSCKSIVSR